MFWLWTLLIYWLVLFAACWMVMEFGQKHYYDEVTPYGPLKAAGATLALAAGLAWWHPSSIDMLTGEIYGTALLGIAAFVLFVVVLQFHPPHALLLGPAIVILVAIASAMAVESIEKSGGAPRERPVPPSQRTVRKSAGTVASPIMDEAEEPAPSGAGSGAATPSP